jgi:glycosyltransferase involved in cell wall biosynthesis
MDVTVVVATHDRPKMLEVELHSILASAAIVGGARIIVVDDASLTDAALQARAICKRLGVEYLRLSENVGTYAALVKGFNYVETPFYTFWGDDDYMLPRWFPLHLAKIAEGYDVVAGSFWKTDADLKLTQMKVLPEARMYDLLEERVTINDGALVRRDAAIEFHPERERATMLTFWLGMLAQGRKFTSIDEPTWLYRRHAHNLSKHRSEHDNALRREAIAAYS